jgi:hypothetical protein
MRIFVMVEPRFPIVREEMPALMDGFAAWRDRYRDRMEVFEFFIGGGGYGIFAVDDEAELHQIFMEYPFTPLSVITTRPTVDGDVALSQWRGHLEAMGQAGQD